MPTILAIDQGTTNTKAVLVDQTGAVRARGSQPMRVAFPQPGWVEQDALAIWNSVLAAVEECLASSSLTGLSALGVTNQRETVVVWDRQTGQPVGPAIVWQCRRTAEHCERLRPHAEEIRTRSGLGLDPLFSASKIAWLLEHAPDGRARAANGELLAGTIDSWLIWKLTGGAAHVTDASNASRTQLLNLAAAQWDSVLLETFGVPAACLPAVRESSGVCGVTVPTGALPGGLPIAGVAGDSHAALFGHAAFAPGALKATYGTGSSLMTPLSRPLLSAHGLSTTVAWALQGNVRHALEGNITNTGGAVEWLASFLQLPGGARDVAALAASVPDSGGVYLVPAFAGLGAPHWDAGARGLLSGLTRGATAAHAARATVESIAYQVADVCRAMSQDTGDALACLLADGGASVNDALMQFQADLLDRPVVRNQRADVAATGVAWLAGLATGCWSSLAELAALPHQVRQFEPAMTASRREHLLAGWADALERSRSHR